MTDSDSKRTAWLMVVRNLVLGGAVMASVGILGRAVIQAFQIKHQEQRVTVTGSASRRIKSDLIVWTAHLRSRSPDLTVAYKKLATDVPTVVDFIKARGVTDQQLTISAASITELHPRTNEGIEQQEIVAAYVAEQTVQVEATDIPKVELISREATQLLDRGVYIQSDAPLYIYTQLAPLKIQMLADASKDARLRAEQIAGKTGATLGKLLTARMGVMQVNPKFSSDVSAEGNNDKSTLEKDAMAVVTASFEVH